MPADGEHRAALAKMVREVRSLPPGPVPEALRNEMLRVADLAVGDFADALFVRAMSVVDKVSRGLPMRDGEMLRGSLLEAVVAFEKEEAEFRRLSAKALEELEAVDARGGREARILFKAAERAERLLLSASLCVETGERDAAAANLQELERMIGCGTEVVGWDEIDVFVAGAPGAGKSSLITRYATDSFEETATIGVPKPVSVLAAIPAPDGSGLVGAELRLRELAERDPSAGALRGCEGLMLVYSQAETGEEEGVGKWFALTRGLPVVRVDNKCDVENAEPSPVDPPPLATSARTGMNVELAFTMLAGAVLMAVPPAMEKKVTKSGKAKKAERAEKTKTGKTPGEKAKAKSKAKTKRRSKGPLKRASRGVRKVLKRLKKAGAERRRKR